MKHTPKFQETPLNFSQLSVLKKVVDEYIHLGDDYILTRVTSSNSKFEAPVARRFDGMTMCICVKGNLKIIINLDEIEVPPNSLLFIPPETVFKPVDWVGEELEAYLLFLSNRFAHDINIDLNAINTSIFTPSSLVLQLDEDKISLLLRYFDLLHLNAIEQNNYNRNIARSLVSAAGYQIMAYGEEAADREAAAHRPGSRKLTYVRKFLRLVRQHHRQERAISFYADKMFISSKYLSLVIKETTGKSACEWIDQYVIQEAKNQLRYSGKNVQQIAYELNFTNQSSFGKYFKNLTGMSPTAFQSIH
ncbi:MAG: AraC family transcriptional regulator [Muribaculaceae bacterium]|nr:AraC family transcriptional regulator [Muribaculaceae bacterium]